jgi:hypothetical protein
MRSGCQFLRAAAATMESTVFWDVTRAGWRFESETFTRNVRFYVWWSPCLTTFVSWTTPN